METTINYREIGTRKFKELEPGEWTFLSAIFSSELNNYAKKSGKSFETKIIAGHMKVTRVK